MPENMTIDLSPMPKAELHLHLEGMPRWETLRQAHRRHYGTELPVVPYWYAADFRFANFGEFASLFREYVHPWLQAPSGYAEVIRDCFDSLIEQNIRYAEINFTPLLVEKFGFSLPNILDLLAAEIDRAKDRNCTIRMFAGLLRDRGSEEAIAWVKKLRSSPIISGFDFQGNEVGWPVDRFLTAIDLAKEAGKRVKAHAGEMTGPENIKIAVERARIDRIGHGTSAIQDPEVVELLRDRHVTVEMCPTSNERLKYVKSYREHPIFDLDAAGIAVTVNSDDPTFFGLNLTDEVSRLMAQRQAKLSDLKRWTHNAFCHAILDEKTRRRYLSELEAWQPTADVLDG